MFLSQDRDRNPFTLCVRLPIIEIRFTLKSVCDMIITYSRLVMFDLRRRKLNFFVVRAVGRITGGLSVDNRLS